MRQTEARGDDPYGEPDALGLLEELVSADEHGIVGPRRPRSPARQRAVTAALTAGALVIGFVVALGLTSSREAAVAMDERKVELIALIQARSAHATELADDLDQLRAKVAEAEDRVAAGVPALQRRIEEVELAAGLRPLRGPGVVVNLDDASTCRSSRPEDCRIQDRDVQMVLNALLASGAEAAAINGERVVSTTAVRRAGRSILVNYRVLAAPYEITILGDDAAIAARFADSDIARDFAAWRDSYGLGFTVERHDEVSVPAYSGSVRTLRARPVEGLAGS